MGLVLAFIKGVPKIQGKSDFVRWAWAFGEELGWLKGSIKYGNFRT